MAILIPVNDRVSTYPGRIQLNPVVGQENVYDMSRADEPVQEGTPLNKALLDQKAYTLTEDTVVHVSPSGSDADGDGSTVTPFATIQAALNALPRILGGHTATIDIANGTYEERIHVTGFSGGNLVIGQQGRNVVVRGIAVSGSSHVTFNIANVTGVAGFSGAIFHVTHDSAVAVGSTMVIDAAGFGEVGIDVDYGSELIDAESAVTVSNCTRNAIRVTNSSKATFHSIAGNDNADFGLVAENGGTISYTNMNLDSAKGNVARTGGRIQVGGGSGTYIHSGNNLTGYGETGKFKATTTGTISAINVNGEACSVKCGEDSEMDIIAGCWYTFILDGNVVNFNMGGSGGSGGAELMIVGGTTRPEKATQNTIWIDTDVEITSDVLSATEPANPVEGMAWIAIGDSSGIKMSSPVGGEWITVYTISAKQYVGGAWVDKTAKIYQGGEWVELGKLEPEYALFWLGNQFTELTGGWHETEMSGNAQHATVTTDDNMLNVTHPTSGYASCSLYCKNMIPISGKSVLKCNIVSMSGSGAFVLCVGTTTNFRPNQAIAQTAITSTGEASIDVSSLSGSYYVYFYTYTESQARTYSVDKVWFE